MPVGEERAISARSLCRFFKSLLWSKMMRHQKTEMTPRPEKFHIMNENVIQSIGRLKACHMNLQTTMETISMRGPTEKSDGGADGST